MSDEINDLMGELDALSDKPADKPADLVTTPKPAVKAEVVTDASRPLPPAPEEPSMDLELARHLMEQYQTVGQEILSSWRADRAEAQDAIDLCNGEIQKAISMGGTPPRMYVEGLVQAIEVKSNANATATSVMGMGIKLASALKSKVSVTNNSVTNIGSINTELNNLLTQNVPDV